MPRGRPKDPVSRETTRWSWDGATPLDTLQRYYFILIISPLVPSWSLAPVEVERM